MRTATVVFDHEVPEQKGRAEWIEFCLIGLEVTTRPWYEPGANWVAELNAAVTSREPLFVIVGRDFDDSRPVHDAWRAALAKDPSHCIVPVYFDGARPGGLLFNRAGIDIGDDSDSARTVLAEAVGSYHVFGGGGARPRRPAPIELEMKELPRLRLLSQRAMTAAGTIGERQFEWSPEAFGQRLYVRRDIQDEVLRRLTPGAVAVVSGRAGNGKTSLLWGVASELLENPGNEVFFIPAALLASRQRAAPLLSADRIATALRETAHTGASAYVLIDTADILVNDDEGFLELMDAARRAADHGAAVLITSRPEEAGQITAGRERPIELRDYDSQRTSEDRPGEFERAVAAHALAYCRRPGDTSDLAAQIGTAVIRERELGAMARHPLTLRMFFELYSPGNVPETIDATDLFESFWLDRVYRDRRNWSSGAVDADTDLTDTAMRLARAMLQAGLPVVAFADFVTGDPANRLKLDSDVAALCARGVVRRDEFGSLAFFHQTFFDYAASKYLLSQPDALGALETRLRARPDDYLLLSVFEQILICGFRDGNHRRESAGLALRVLGDDLAAQPFSIRRRVLLVLAQSALDGAVRERVTATLSDAATEAPIVREFLSLLPRPGRTWNTADDSLLAACAGRVGSAWHGVVDVLVRMARSDPDTVLRLFRAMDPATKSRLLGAQSIGRAETRELLRILFVHGPNRLPDLLRELPDIDPAVAQAATLCKLFALLDVDSSNPAAASEWADEICRTRNPEPLSMLIESAARLHRRTVAARPPEVRWSGLRGEIATATDAIAVGGKRIPIPESAFVWGALMALAEAEALVTEASETGWCVAALFDLFEGIGSPVVHAEAHHGWFVGLLRRSAVARACAVGLLVRGLPSNHNHPGADDKRWADTIRRTLERQDVDSATLAAIASPVADRLLRAAPVAEARTGTEVWTDPDLLLRVLLPAAGAGVESAESALSAVNAGTAQLNSVANRILLQQG